MLDALITFTSYIQLAQQHWHARMQITTSQVMARLAAGIYDHGMLWP